MTPSSSANAPSPILPVLMCVAAAVLFGLWWVPIRYLDGLGLSGTQTAIYSNLGGALVLLAWLAVNPAKRRIGTRAMVGAMLVGLSYTLYSTALATSDVVRVILLFYLAPAWGKIIEWGFMRQPWRRSASLTLAASFSGAFLVMGGELSVKAVNLGDAMAILSGISWAVGATLIFTGGRPAAATLTVSALVATILTAIVFALIGGEALVPDVAASTMLKALLIGMFVAIPSLMMTLWSAQRLSPALISFVFTFELLTGVISGALLLDEPFGMFQASGSALIVSAALIEVVVALQPRRETMNIGQSVSRKP